MQAIALTTDATPDPNALPPANISGTASSVTVDPTVTPPAAAKVVEGRPAWLDPKFETPEALAKAYTELSKKLGTPAEPVTPPAAKAPAPVVTPEAAKAAGIDMNALSTEFASNGELSAETLKLLADKGFDKAAVDGYIAGQQAIAEKLGNELAALAGGKPQLDAALAWAKANLSAEDAAAYDAAVDSGNLGLTKLALQGLLSQFNEATGKDPSLVTGAEVLPSSGVAPFASNAEVTAAMRDPRYAKDPAYREKVAQRLYVTNTFGQ